MFLLQSSYNTFSTGVNSSNTRSSMRGGSSYSFATLAFVFLQYKLFRHMCMCWIALLEEGREGGRGKNVRIQIYQRMSTEEEKKRGLEG